mmetsp:Transcript_11351/g.17155  ORF Transcript_11351/g.17155 Transcript_11351/m.17155 type:complete len:215 (+) Transcript_11351:383-1027(+)
MGEDSVHSFINVNRRRRTEGFQKRDDLLVFRILLQQGLQFINSRGINSSNYHLFDGIRNKLITAAVHSLGGDVGGPCNSFLLSSLQVGFGGFDIIFIKLNHLSLLFFSITGGLGGSMAVLSGFISFLVFTLAKWGSSLSVHLSIDLLLLSLSSSLSGSGATLLFVLGFDTNVEFRGVVANVFQKLGVGLTEHLGFTTRIALGMDSFLFWVTGHD